MRTERGKMFNRFSQGWSFRFDYGMVNCNLNHDKHGCVCDLKTMTGMAVFLLTRQENLSLRRFLGASV